MRKKVKVLLVVAALIINLLPLKTQKASAFNSSLVDAGSYYFKNAANGKYLDASGAGDYNNCDVITYSFNGSSAQVWNVSLESNGYKIKPKCTASRVLNQYGDNVVSGHNVCLWDNTYHPSQRWVFECKAGNGYIIHCAGNTNCVLDINSSGSVCVRNYNPDSYSQIWYLTPAEVEIYSGYYYIQNVNSGKYLDASGAGDYNNCDVITYTFNGTNAQKWYISGSPSSYKIKPKCTVSRVLNQYGDNVESGHNVCLWDNTNHPSQRWSFEAVPGSNAFMIHCAGNPNCVLDVTSGNSVYVRERLGCPSQLWVLIPAN